MMMRPVDVKDDEFERGISLSSNFFLDVSRAVRGEEIRGGTRHLFMILLQASDI